ncbi:MAG: imidazolonepropionase [Thermoplasmata archaeon]
MDRADFIIRNISQLLTMDENFTIIENAYIAGVEGKILSYGPMENITNINLNENATIINASKYSVMPAFVDPHTHMVFDGNRANELVMKIKGYSYTKIAEMGGGILKTVRATRHATEYRLNSLLSKRLKEFAYNGVGTVEIKSGYGLNKEDEFKMLNTINNSTYSLVKIVPTFLGAHAIPPEKSYGEYVSLVKSLIPEIAKNKMAKFIDVFCEKGYFNEEDSKEILEEGRKYGLIPKIHADEFSDSHGGLIAAEVNAISADHLLKTPKEALSEMSKKNVVPVILPGTIFSSFIDSTPDIQAMRELNMPIAIGSDFNPNCMISNHEFLLWLAVYKMKMTMEEALRGVTINAAMAIGMDREVGSVKEGKSMDLIILNTKTYTDLFYEIGKTHIKKVILKGKEIK